ncbi:hypothetical protein [Rheinheimera sp.]|uniref:hypothetical protein n=1 Tax=Rheinheimera sp. TaxID=1869214 RepID=UPI00307D0C40
MSRRLVTCLLLLYSGCSLALDVIVHPGVAMTELNVIQLRSIYSMRQQNWPDGKPIRVFVLPAKTQLHQEFSKQKLQMFPYQLDRIWQKITYSGLGSAPVVVNSTAQMLEMVSSTTGAIGYVEDADEDSSVTVLPVRH